MNNHINYFLEICKLSLKTSKEYKTNFYMMVLFDIVILFVHMLVLTIIHNTVPEVLTWNTTDLFLFFTISLLLWKNLWLHNLRNFDHTLLSGLLNTYRTKPLNTYFQTSCKNINGQNLISSIIIYIIVFYVLTSQNYSNLLLGTLLHLFGTIYFFIFFNVIQSFYFYMKRNDIGNIIFRSQGTAQSFTPKIFENMKFGEIIFFLPISIGSYFTIEIFKGNYQHLLALLPYIIAVFFILIGLLITIWKFGLKKYEAYG